MGNSHVSVYRTICPTLVYVIFFKTVFTMFFYFFFMFGVPCNKDNQMVSNEMHLEKTYILHMQKQKAQISCMVTLQLISPFVFAK